MKAKRAWLIASIFGVLCTPAVWCDDADVASLIRQIQSVGSKGSGNAAASRASRELARRGPEVLPQLLNALNGADAVSANWLRGAVDTIAEKTVKAGRPLPVAELESFVLERTHSGPARRLAYEWLAKVDATAPDRLIPGMLDDPSVELRRDAVARSIDQAKEKLDAGDRQAATDAFLKTFAAARDRDQVTAIAKQLESLGQTIDLTKHFGCLQRWHVIGPFDNTDKSGFPVAYAPEKRVDLEAEYPGKSSRVRWIEHTTADPYGIVDLNKVIGKHMGVVGYATTEFESSESRPVQIRVGTFNAVKVWLNGELLFTRDEYHHGMSMDQYVATGKLKEGRNQILLKLCQNEQKEEWAQNWMFQARVCDLTGGGL